MYVWFGGIKTEHGSYYLKYVRLRGIKYHLLCGQPLLLYPYSETLSYCKIASKCPFNTSSSVP